MIFRALMEETRRPRRTRGTEKEKEKAEVRSDEDVTVHPSSSVNGGNPFLPPLRTLIPGARARGHLSSPSPSRRVTDGAAGAAALARHERSRLISVLSRHDGWGRNELSVGQ